jgi:Flp pilus assembly protein TadG
MTTARAAFGICSRLVRFAPNRDGVAAVEFAIVLPFMLTLYLGSVELGDGLAIQFKTAYVARTVTDLASQYITIDTSMMSSILDASSIVVTPYSPSNMVVTLSEITTNSHGSGTITWSCSLNGTPRTWGASYTLPTNLQTPNITVLFGEVTYSYTPAIGYVITGTINIYQNAYFYPRLTTTIGGPGTTSSSCPTS